MTDTAQATRTATVTDPASVTRTVVSSLAVNLPTSVAETVASGGTRPPHHSDEAKTLLPEFRNRVGASAVHEESSDMAATVTDMSMAAGDNILLPVVGRSYDGLVARIEGLAQAGYSVNLHLVDRAARSRASIKLAALRIRTM